MPAQPIDIKIHLADLLRVALASVAPGVDAEIHLERPRDASHGDFACNLAMQIAKSLKENPRKIAERLVHELPVSAWVLKADVAGAGFINFTVAAAAKTAVVHAVLTRGDDFGRGAKQPGKMQVEFVSANPTGPLHVGHGRGAAFGASLANLLAFAGIPLTSGFMGKYAVFSAAVAHGGWVLALIGGIASAVAAFFYVRVIVLMYFSEPTGSQAVVAIPGIGTFDPNAGIASTSNFQ